MGELNEARRELEARHMTAGKWKCSRCHLKIKDQKDEVWYDSSGTRNVPICKPCNEVAKYDSVQRTLWEERREQYE